MSALIWSSSLGLQRDVQQLHDRISVIMAGIAFAVTDRVTSWLPGVRRVHAGVIICGAPHSTWRHPEYKVLVARVDSHEHRRPHPHAVEHDVGIAV